MSFLDRFFRGSDSKADNQTPLAYVLGLKWSVRSRAEQHELLELEVRFRECGIANVVLDKVEPGHNEVSFWFHAANAKKAFKELSELPDVSSRMSGLQAAYAERSKMKFSILWPKGSQANIPAGLG